MASAEAYGAFDHVGDCGATWWRRGHYAEARFDSHHAAAFAATLLSAPLPRCAAPSPCPFVGDGPSSFQRWAVTRSRAPCCIVVRSWASVVILRLVGSPISPVPRRGQRLIMPSAGNPCETARATLAHAHDMTVSAMQQHVQTLGPADRLAVAYRAARRHDDDTLRASARVPSGPSTSRGVLARQMKLTVREAETHFRQLPWNDPDKRRWDEAGADDARASRARRAARRNAARACASDDLEIAC